MTIRIRVRTGRMARPALRVVLNAAKAHAADYVLLVGDIFDNNRQSPGIIEQCVALLNDVARPVIVLPGNHDPVTPDSVWLRGGLNKLPHVHIIGVTHDLTVHFPEHDLEVWGHAHVDYNNMVPLREPRPRTARWHVTLAHGHYEDDGVRSAAAVLADQQRRDRGNTGGLPGAGTLEPGGARWGPGRRCRRITRGRRIWRRR